jgi:hypothetical protein
MGKWWYDDELGAGTCHKCGIKWIPIGQVKKKSKKQKVKLGSNFEF